MEENKKETPVEWLFQQLWDTPKDKFTWYSILSKALEKEKEGQIKTILTSEITTHHIVVGIRSNKPVILSKTDYDGGKYCFVCIDREFTEHNCYPENDTIKEAVEEQMKCGQDVEVFQERDWKEALQWLIDNVD